VSLVPETRAELTPVAFAATTICDEAVSAAARVLRSGWVTTGPATARFEAEIASLVQARHAVGTSSCTAAIELALRGLHLAPGSKVLVSTVTFCGAAHAISHAGLQPVLVDVDPWTGMPSPETTAIAAAACGGADAMLVVHLGGYPAPVQELAAAAGLTLDRIVEDAAHALGTWVGDRPVGSLSRATCFSFYATKNLPIGEGGMVTTDDDELALYCRRARLHGMSADAWRRYLPGGSWRYTVDELGLKANLTDLQSAIGSAQLRHLPEWQRRREQIAGRYFAGLAGLAGPGLGLPAVPVQGVHAWHLYVIRVRPGLGITRDDLAVELAERGIATSVHFIPLHTMAHFRATAERQLGGLPVADALFEQLLSLPLHPALTDDDVDRVIDAIWSCARVDRAALMKDRNEGGNR
jgi:dTDP-4-amino-4,6-dideoxygalactose transaminase